MRRFTWAVALLLVASCGGQEARDNARSSGRGKADDGFASLIDQNTDTFRHDYVLGAIPASKLNAQGQCPTGLNGFTGTDGTLYCQALGGMHQVYIPEGGREPIDYQNQPLRLHPDLKDGYLLHKAELEQCGENGAPDSCQAGVTNVFASQWWPQAENGIAWRWNGSGGYEDLDDARGLSPSEKYDLLFNTLASSCTADEKVTVAGKTFCMQKVSCGSNKCEDDAGKEVACSAAEAKHCINYSYQDTKKGCLNGTQPDNHTCSKQKHPMVKVVGPATKWELENHGEYQSQDPDSWWGHCNGWASYATAEALSYPKRDVCVKYEQGKVKLCATDFGSDGQATGATAACGTAAGTEGCMLFRMGDIEALMSELYFSDAATFSGRRCNEMPEDIEDDEFGRPKPQECRDINAGTFHVAITGLLGEGVTPFAGGDKTKLAFVIDHNWDYQVWNFPLVKYRFKKVTKLAADGSNCPVEIADVEPGEQNRAKVCAAVMVSAATAGAYSFNPEAKQFVAVKMDYWMVSDGVSSYSMRQRADLRGDPTHQSEMNYILELDGQGKIVGGEWTKDTTYQWGDDNKKAHPDFLWMAIKPSSSYDDPTDTKDGDNPKVNYLIAKQLLQCSNDPSTCGGDEPPPPPPGGDEELVLERTNQSLYTSKTYSNVVLPAGTQKVRVELTPAASIPGNLYVELPCTTSPANTAATCESTEIPAGLKITVRVRGSGTYGSKGFAIKVFAVKGDDPPPPPPSDNICTGFCGKSPDGFSCYCDDSCVQYKDCCQNAQGAKGESHDYVDAACGAPPPPPPPPPPPTANICTGFCGKKPSGFDCYCDESCKQDQYKDCCQNAQGDKGQAHDYVLEVCSF